MLSPANSVTAIKAASEILIKRGFARPVTASSDWRIGETGWGNMKRSSVLAAAGSIRTTHDLHAMNAYYGRVDFTPPSTINAPLIHRDTGSGSIGANPPIRMVHEPAARRRHFEHQTHNSPGELPGPSCVRCMAK
jgi:hypothetical protein